MKKLIIFLIIGASLTLFAFFLLNNTALLNIKEILAIIIIGLVGVFITIFLDKHYFSKSKNSE